MFLVLKFCVSFYHLFQCEKNVFESTDGPYPQLTVQCTEVGMGKSPVEPVNRAGGEEQIEGKEKAGGSRACRQGEYCRAGSGGEQHAGGWGVEQARGSKAGRG